MKQISFTVDINLLLIVVLTILVLSLFKVLIVMRIYEDKKNVRLAILYYLLEPPAGWIFILTGTVLAILDIITKVEKESRFDEIMKEHYTFYEKEE